ncbi:MAG: metal-sensitive transcriptional regulator [Chloroflexota bacterium]|nr:metal-sensitive transcriptional regulator [Chloroflexota bacterium]MDQ6907289.1 metal-sensitive transcriptional regulator [Chloroflexota bacterium]
MDATKATKPDYHYQTETDALLLRLRRMEGQVRGVQKMIEEGRYCVDIVTQLQAIAAAADKVSQQVLEGHIRGCVADAIKEQRGDEAITELMTVLGKAMRG